ncbi:MAG TPA: hypothetical protein VJ302_09400 [Blastocatellia bacterium]|nr:hypothetical protein [Blastocatellia bacterium]
MPTKNSTKSGNPVQRIKGTSSDAVGVTQAKKAGTEFEWHYGRMTRIGSFDLATGNREIVIVWEEGGVSSQQGSITDEQWEIFKLAFSTTGRIAVLSDQTGDGWMYDYRFVEAVR